MKSTLASLPTPDLSDDQFLGAVCALRPCRHGGPRLEIENIGLKTIVHNYGHGGCGVTISLGSAQIAADLVDQCSTPKAHVAILGAGVIGLTTAIELLNRGYTVDVYADKIAHDTTSNIAGALWLPMAIEFGNTIKDEELKSRLLVQSHRAFQELDRARYGLELLPIYEPAESDTELGLFGHLFDHGLVELPEEVDAFPFQSAAKPGQRFTTDFIHMHLFLDAILEDIAKLGGVIHQRKITTQEELAEFNQPVVVNCLGLGARGLFGDKQVYSARGVLVHMKPQDLGYGIHDGFKYMFPRKNALILGGCCQEYDWDDEPDQVMIDEILNHHRRFFGQL